MIIQTYSVLASGWTTVTAPARCSGLTLRALNGDVTIASDQNDTNQQDTLYNGEQEALHSSKFCYEKGQTICYLKAGSGTVTVKGYFVPANF
jgi:hypothetical protein